MNNLQKPFLIAGIGMLGSALLVGCGKKDDPKPSPGTPPETSAKTNKTATPPASTGTITKPDTPKVKNPNSATPGAPLSFDEAEDLKVNESAAFEAFNGDWLGHDSDGKFVQFKINTTTGEQTIQTKSYKKVDGSNNGPCRFNEATKRVEWGCLETDNCTHSAALTVDGKLQIQAEAAPTEQNQWKGVNFTALLVKADDPQAGEYTNFRTRPPLTQVSQAEYESFQASLQAGGASFASTNEGTGIRNLPAPLDENDFIWLIKPSKDIINLFPTNLPVAKAADPSQPPEKPYNQVNLLAMAVPGKKPLQGRIQIVCEARLFTSRRSDRSTQQVELNPGVNQQGFSFSYKYIPQPGSNKYTGNGQFRIYLVSKGAEPKVISNVLTQKFKFN